MSKNKKFIIVYLKILFIFFLLIVLKIFIFCRVNIDDDLTPYISDLHFYGTKDIQFEKGVPKKIKTVRRHGEIDFDPRDFKANRQVRIDLRFQFFFLIFSLIIFYNCFLIIVMNSCFFFKNV